MNELLSLMELDVVKNLALENSDWIFEENEISIKTSKSYDFLKLAGFSNEEIFNGANEFLKVSIAKL